MTRNKRLVFDHFTAHENVWCRVRDVRTATGLPTDTHTRNACWSLHSDGLLISTRDEPWRARMDGLAFRTRRGYMASSRFEQGAWLVEVIWVGEEPIVGPFCKHCGNPSQVHGPERECLNYRIHPTLPMGDLPRAAA